VRALGRAIGEQRLFPHHAPSAPDVTVLCDVDILDDTIVFSFFVNGAIDQLVIPSGTSSGRTDGLWQHSCFEAFLKPQDAASYTELNFSPSGQWAAYSFAGYRQGMADLPLHGIACSSSMSQDDGRGQLVVRAAILTADSPLLPCQLSLSAVIEARDGTKSYWAVRHPPGKPDFHHPDCFALTLEAPDRA
jgi:hypothetical protein